MIVSTRSLRPVTDHERSPSPRSRSVVWPIADAAPDHLGAEASSSATIGILLAAGDIARCASNGTPSGRPKETAALITKQINEAPAGVPVRVLVLGDLPYEYGEPKSFSGCFDPAWGSFKDKMLPVPGNHEYWKKLPDGTYPKPGSKCRQEGHQACQTLFRILSGQCARAEKRRPKRLLFPQFS